MGEFVECGDSSPHGSESGDKSPHSTFGGLNDDQGQANIQRFDDFHLALECKNSLRWKDYSEITDKAKRSLQKTADEIGMIPCCLGGSEALAVFTSHWRDIEVCGS